MMVASMLSTGHKNKVLRTIIVSNAINMVDSFIRLQAATLKLRHDQHMFSNVPIRPSVGVLRKKDKDIALGRAPSTFPIGVSLSFPATFRSTHDNIVPQVYY